MTSSKWQQKLTQGLDLFFTVLELLVLIFFLLSKASWKNRFAETTVKTSITNNDDKAREAEIDLLIPMDAFVMKFTMEVDGNVIEGKVEEKQKAKKVFENVSKNQIS